MPDTMTQKSVAAPTNLEELIWPLAPDEFLQRFWNLSFLHSPGPSDRFSQLCSWAQVSAILEQQFVRPPRLRVVKNGIAIAPQRYTDFRDPDFPMIKAKALNRELSNGATIELNIVECTHKPLLELTVALEHQFRSPAWAMLFGSWRTDKVSNLHWDHHEVFVSANCWLQTLEGLSSHHRVSLWQA